VPNFLTQKGLKKLQQELDKIKKTDLPDVLQAINVAREEGDLKENAGYQSAMKIKDELEARIAELQEILNDYTLIDENAIDNNTVQVGNTVKVKFFDPDLEKEVKIVGSSESDVLQNKVSNDSPLITSILGKKVGQEAEFKAPRGKTKVKILQITQ